MRVRVVAVMIAVVLLGAACGNASSKSSSTTTVPTGSTVAPTVNTADLTVHHPISEKGVTDSEIRVSVVADITNPLGDPYQPFADGINAYFAMMNSSGGIYGRQLKVAKVRDDQLANNATQVQAALSQDNPFAVFIATSLFTGANTLAAANVPTFGWNINAEWNGHDTFFPNGAAHCFTCTDPILPWIAKQVGTTKVGVLAYNVQQSADCATADEKSFTKFPTAKVVFSDKTIPFGVTDLSAQVAQMKQKGVDLVVTCFDLNGAFTLAKEMKTQGLNAIQVLPNSYNHDFMKANGSYFEGSYVTPNLTALEDTPQPPLMKTFLTWMGKTKKKVSELAIQGWIAADQFVTGLKLAGPDFNRGKVVAALNSQKAYDAGGMLAPIDWTVAHVDPGKRLSTLSGLDCWNWVQIKNGAFVPAFAQGDKPWVCFDYKSEKPASSTPMAVPPAKNYTFVPTGQ